MRTETSGRYEGSRYQPDTAYREKIAQSRKYTNDSESRTERLKERKEEAGEIRNQIKRTFFQKKQVSYDAVSDMLKLMVLQKPGQVKTFRAKMKQKAAGLQRSGGDDAAIRAAVAKIKKVLKKASVKIRGLEEESRMEARQASAERAKERDTARAIDHELQRKRSTRRIKERNDVIEALKDSKAGTLLQNQTEEKVLINYLDSLSQSVSDIVSSSPAAAGSAPGAAVLPSGAAE